MTGKSSTVYLIQITAHLNKHQIRYNQKNNDVMKLHRHLIRLDSIRYDKEIQWDVAQSGRSSPTWTLSIITLSSRPIRLDWVVRTDWLLYNYLLDMFINLYELINTHLQMNVAQSDCSSATWTLDQIKSDRETLCGGSQFSWNRAFNTHFKWKTKHMTGHATTRMRTHQHLTHFSLDA